MKGDDFILIPLENGVRIVVKGVPFFKPYTPKMLIDMGVRFVECGNNASRLKTEAKNENG